MRSLSRNGVLALIGVTLVLHTTEEHLTFPAYLASANQLPRFLPPPALMQDPQNLRIALLAATVLPLAVVVWAIVRPRKASLVAVLFLECILLINAGWHIFAACVRGGYAPGVITAILINLPFGVYVIRRATKDQWISARVAWLLLSIALVVHLAAAGTFLAG